MYKNAEHFLKRKEEKLRKVFEYLKTKPTKTSNFTGVCRFKGKWAVRIGLNNKKYFLGYYGNQIEAAKAYDKKAIELGFPGNGLNFKYNESIDIK